MNIPHDEELFPMYTNTNQILFKASEKRRKKWSLSDTFHKEINKIWNWPSLVTQNVPNRKDMSRITLTRNSSNLQKKTLIFHCCFKRGI